MRRPLLLLAGLILLAGCGQSASPALPLPTAPVLKTYRDARNKFSFEYPGGWSVTKQGGHYLNVAGVKTYIIDLNTTNNEAGVRVTLDHDVIPLPSFPEGKIAPEPNSPDTLHYHHLHVSGWPAMEIERYSGKQIDAMFTIANTRTESYQVQMITGTPPFPADAISGYNTIIKTLKVPFS